MWKHAAHFFFALMLSRARPRTLAGHLPPYIQGTKSMNTKLTFLLAPALGICLTGLTWGQTAPDKSARPSTSYPGAQTPGTFPGTTNTPGTPGLNSPDSTTSAPRTGNNSNRDVNSTGSGTANKDKSTSGTQRNGASSAPDTANPGSETYPGSTSGSSATQPDRGPAIK